METTVKTAIAYLRVSTQRQAASGLGLEAQQEACMRFAKLNNLKIVEFVIEAESGKKNNRAKLMNAIETCARNNHTLLVAKLDRLSRDVEFLFALKRTKIDFVVCDNPSLNTLTLAIFAGLAQHEREMISARTKAALAAKKARGESKRVVNNLTSDVRKLGVEAIKAKAQANENTRKAKLVAKSLRDKHLTLREIASELNAAGFKTANNKQFTATQVMRLLK